MDKIDRLVLRDGKQAAMEYLYDEVMRIRGELKAGRRVALTDMLFPFAPPKEQQDER